MSIPGRLEVASTGHVTGPASVTYNEPFPCVNGSWGSGAIRGLVLHTMVGDLPGTTAWFNDPAAQASAHFGVSQLGAIHQFGPVGKSWAAWAEAAGNMAWYSVEMADNGNPANPLTTEQVTAAAQLLEVLSRFAGFPLQVTDDVNGQGLITHGDGGSAWGGHPDCPGPVRKAQRPAIVELAKQIRSGASSSPPPGVREWTTAGQDSLGQLAAASHTDVATVLRLTAQHGPGATFPPAVASYVDGVFAGAIDPRKPAPAGLTLYLPA